jgi:hypothetical protein
MVSLKNQGFDWAGVRQKCILLQNCHSEPGVKQMTMVGWAISSWYSDDDARIVVSIINLAYPRMDRVG